MRCARTQARRAPVCLDRTVRAPLLNSMPQWPFTRWMIAMHCPRRNRAIHLRSLMKCARRRCAKICAAGSAGAWSSSLRHWTMRISAKRWRAPRARGLALSADVSAYLLTHFKRELPALMALLDALDRFSLEHQRAVTLPLVRAWREEHPVKNKRLILS